MARAVTSYWIFVCALSIYFVGFMVRRALDDIAKAIREKK